MARPFARHRRSSLLLAMFAEVRCFSNQPQLAAINRHPALTEPGVSDDTLCRYAGAAAAGGGDAG